MLSNHTMELYRSTLASWVEDPGVDEFEGLDMGKLGIDQAYVLTETVMKNVGLYAISDDCYKCPYELHQTIRNNASATLTMSTAHGSSWRLLAAATGQYAQYISTKNRSGLVCELRPDLGEFGVYKLNVSSAACNFTTLKEPVNIYLPLLLAVLVLGGAGVLCAAGSALLALARRKGKLRYGDAELASPQRLRALDTFRGLTIVLMIFVNYGGGHYQRWIEHATWNGLHAADVVFPCFVWTMGVCIPLSVKGVLARNVPRWKALLHILRRSCMLFMIGVSLQSTFGFDGLHSLRVMGVLQRLGLSYLVVASCCLLTTRKYFTHPRGACGQALKDVWAAAWCWVLAAVALALHTFLTMRLHDPDCPPGYLGPGGHHDNWAVAASCTGGAAAYIDRLLLGASHGYKNLTVVQVYRGSNIDPENLLGTLTTVVHVVLGVQAGATLQHYKGHHSRVARWLAWAVLLFLVGAILAGFSKEKGFIPINKNLWSISFVLVMSALSSILLSACYVLTDAWRLWGGAPFHAAGRNAIFLYVGHGVCSYMFPFRLLGRSGARTHAAYLFENLWATGLWVVVAHIMARKKIFITL